MRGRVECIETGRGNIRQNLMSHVRHFILDAREILCLKVGE